MRLGKASLSSSRCVMIRILAKSALTRLMASTRRWRPWASCEPKPSSITRVCRRAPLRRDTVLAEGALERFVATDLYGQFVTAGFEIRFAGAQVVQHADLLARGSDFVAQAIFALLQAQQFVVGRIHIRGFLFGPGQGCRGGSIFILLILDFSLAGLDFGM